MRRDRVNTIAAAISNCSIGVVGDLILDQYIWGHATRISPEAPVPIVKVERKTTTLGGAANVLRNLKSLGAGAQAFGVIGDDAGGIEMLTLCERWGILTPGVVRSADRVTTVKTRLLADNQQVARIDEEIDSQIGDEIAERLRSGVCQQLRSGALAALIAEDYNKGVLSGPFLQHLVALAREHNVPVALDPHPGNRMPIKGLTLITPNRAEAFALTGEFLTPTVLPLSADAGLIRVGARLMVDWAPDILLITLGKDGMAVFQPDKPPHHIPTAAREVYDVSGAGDTVIASFMAAMCGGATALESAELANHAAGLAVAHVGTVSVEMTDIIQTFA